MEDEINVLELGFLQLFLNWLTNKESKRFEDVTLWFIINFLYEERFSDSTIITELSIYKFKVSTITNQDIYLIRQQRRNQYVKFLDLTGHKRPLKTFLGVSTPQVTKIPSIEQNEFWSFAYEILNISLLWDQMLWIVANHSFLCLCQKELGESSTNSPCFNFNKQLIACIKSDRLPFSFGTQISGFHAVGS